jgi:AraC family transcriptional regulator
VDGGDMNFYVGLITDVINYIENHIGEGLSLEDLATEFGFSAFHFNRIFRTITGRTLKQYILGRKLTLAMEPLSVQTETIIDIAFNFGFKSPEVFSRAFKKQFGVSPYFFRKNRPCLESVQKAALVERDIINFQGQLALKGRPVYLDAFELRGVKAEINVNRAGFEKDLETHSNMFYQKAIQSGQFNPDLFYTLVNCLGEDNGNYNVFWGMKTAVSIEDGPFLSRVVPAGWYEVFNYVGDMFDIRLSFINDLYRWVMVKEIELEANGIGMLNIFKADYAQTQAVEILVPIKPPR